MKKACRDCGNELDAGARGCPRCARNEEAERMIDRFIWLRLVPVVIVILLVGAGIIFLWLRK